MDPNTSVPGVTPVDPAADGLERQSPAQQQISAPPQPGYGRGGQGPSSYPAQGARSLPQYGYPQAPPRPLQPPFSLRPPSIPGPILIGLTAIVMGIGILGSTGPDLDTMGWIAILAGLNIGFVWIVLLIVAAQDTRLRFDRRTWARWAGQPAIFFIAIVLMTSGVPAAIRFDMSRPQLEQAAARAQAGSIANPGFVGLMQVYRTTTDGDMTLFEISASDRSNGCALVYAASNSTRLSNWLDSAWSIKQYGHGWWYGCQGGSPSD